MGLKENFIYFLVLIVLISSSFQKRTQNKKVIESKRKPKVVPLFQIITFKNDPCISTNQNGTCYSREECASKGGSSSTTCANGFGVCCVFNIGCGATTSENCTYITQSSTTSAPNPNPCTYTICKCSSDICRFRLDFTTFQITGPAVGTAIATTTTDTGKNIGDCLTDTFVLTSPGNRGSPVICGYNTGQHMIVDANDACSVANFNIGSGTETREWSIKVTQYKCGDENGGPPDCLQYFTGVSGRISNFNYPTNLAGSITDQTTHLSSQCYSMCFRREEGRCSICYTPFHVGASTTSGNQNSFGLSISPNAGIAQARGDSLCPSDYLQIPNAFNDGITTVVKSRICGRIFSVSATSATTVTVCSSTTPFKVQFKTDEDEQTDGPVGDDKAMINEEAEFPAGIIGFSLFYFQKAC